MIQQGTAHEACHSSAQHAMTWDCMTQHGMALHGMMQHGTAQHDVAQQGTAWRRPPHLGMALHSTAQHDLIKCVCNPNLHSADLITAASNFPPCYHESQDSNTFCSLCCCHVLAEQSCLPLFLQGFCRSPAPSHTSVSLTLPMLLGVCRHCRRQVQQQLLAGTSPAKSGICSCVRQCWCSQHSYNRSATDVCSGEAQEAENSTMTRVLFDCI